MQHYEITFIIIIININHHHHIHHHSSPPSSSSVLFIIITIHHHHHHHHYYSSSSLFIIIIIIIIITIHHHHHYSSSSSLFIIIIIIIIIIITYLTAVEGRTTVVVTEWRVSLEGTLCRRQPGWPCLMPVERTGRGSTRSRTHSPGDSRSAPSTDLPHREGVINFISVVERVLDIS